MCQTPLQKYLFLGYVNAQSTKPNVGRRQLKLEMVEQFWKLDQVQKNEQIKLAASMEEPASLEPGSDPYDIPGLKGSRVIGTRGVIVRTHFDSNDEPAWDAFLTLLEELERKSLADVPNIQMEGDSDSEADDEEMAEAGPPPITYESDAVFTVVDPVKQEAYQTLRDRLSNASNIALLRLFNDVSIAPSPSPPASEPKRIKPGHRLIDEDGFQEVYSGSRIWVWDHQSAKDQALRLVSPQVFVYGDATGDSWRVKVAHIWELQLNLDDGMRVDFSGGVGAGWNMSERTRNLRESTSYVYRLRKCSSQAKDVGEMVRSFRTHALRQQST